MTEQEAKTKWCPFARGAANRGSHGAVSESRCIASDCLAWHWHPGEAYHPVVLNLERTRGFCGLAGKP